MKQIRIECEVKRVIHRNNETKYSVLDVDIIKYQNGETPPTSVYTIKGNYKDDISNGDIYRVEGMWIDNGIHGLQFEFSEMVLKTPETEVEIEKLLIRHIKGVGRKTAKTLVNAFGTELFEVIVDKPEELMELEGISEKLVERLRDANNIYIMEAFEKTQKALDWLLYKDVTRLIEKFGNLASDVVMKNPYIAVEAIGFKQCDITAKKLGFKKDNNNRIAKAIVEVLIHDGKKGHNYGNLNEVIQDVNNFLNKSKIFKDFELSREQFNMCLSLAVSVRDVEVESDRVYLRYYAESENDIIFNLVKMINSNTDKVSENRIEKFLKEKKKDGLDLTEKQKQAIAMALNNRISIITGGPGTGKTFTSSVVIEAIQELEPDKKIILAAPTGMAAKNMTSASGMVSSTIHSLLRIHKEETIDVELIDAEYVIIDEASMIDLLLFRKLLLGIQDYTKLLLMGDVDQLPPIGPGSILRDLIDSDKITMVELKEVHRQVQGSQIITNAKKIRDEIKKMDEDKTKRDFYFIDSQKQEEIQGTTLNVVKRLLETGFSMNEIQVITPQNVGDLGTIKLNQTMQEMFNKNRRVRILTRTFKVGDKVIHTKNNRDIGVYNGETGIIREINERPEMEIIVDFGDKVITYTSGMFSELELAYVLTTHKMQGSEKRAIVMILAEEHDHMLTKSLLYTSLTRATERMIFVGEREQYYKAMTKNYDIKRRSMLKGKLKGQMKRREMSA